MVVVAAAAVVREERERREGRRRGWQGKRRNNAMAMDFQLKHGRSRETIYIVQRRIILVLLLEFL